MSDLVVSCLQTSYPLTADDQLVTLDDNLLNFFHGFRVSQPIVDHMQRKVEDEGIYPYQYNFDRAVWGSIFRYLTAKEIFRFVITATRWCHACQLNELRNQYVFFGSMREFKKGNYHGPFMNVLQNLTAHERVRITTFESIKQSVSPKETVYEGIGLDQFIVLARKANGVTHYGKIHDVSERLRGMLAERQDWFTHLQRMQISRAKFNCSDLKDILNACPQLSDLKIVFNDQGGDPLIPIASLNNHEKLERLDLSEVKLQSSNLQVVLGKTPNLRVLILRKSGVSDKGAIHLLPNSLLYLEKMILAGANFTGPDIFNLLLAAPHVNEVDLSCQTLEASDSGVSHFNKRVFKNHSRLHNSFSGLPEKSLLFLEMIHIGPTFFVPGQLLFPPAIIQTIPVDRLAMVCSTEAEMTTQFAFTIADLNALLKASPNLNQTVQALIISQIDLQQKLVDIKEYKRRQEAPAPSLYPPRSSLIDHYREVSEKMRVDSEKMKKENERALAKMKKDLKKIKKYK